MKGYEVVTFDGGRIGHVVGEDGEFLIVEHGLRKTKHAVPRRLTEFDEAEGVVRTTLSKELINDSPKFKGDLDHEAIAEHYGLAEGYPDPPTRGLHDLEPDDNAYAADESLREEIEARKKVVANEGPFDETPSGPGGTSGHRSRDYDGD